MPPLFGVNECSRLEFGSIRLIATITTKSDNLGKVDEIPPKKEESRLSNGSQDSIDSSPPARTNKGSAKPPVSKRNSDSRNRKLQTADNKKQQQLAAETRKMESPRAKAETGRKSAGKPAAVATEPSSGDANASSSNGCDKKCTSKSGGGRVPEPHPSSLNHSNNNNNLESEKSEFSQVKRSKRKKKKRDVNSSPNSASKDHNGSSDSTKSESKSSSQSVKNAANCFSGVAGPRLPKR